MFSLFIWLNRAVRASIFLAGCLGIYGLWQQWERARPAVDYYYLLRDAGWQNPKPLPRWEGTFVRLASPGILEATNEQGKKWRFTLLGLSSVNPDVPPHFATNRWFLRHNSTNINLELKGTPIEIGIISTNADRTGSGFLYRTNQIVHADWLKQGRYRLRQADCRQLPLRDQYQMRLSDRFAREKRLGIWSLPGQPPPAEGESN